MSDVDISEEGVAIEVQVLGRNAHASKMLTALRERLTEMTAARDAWQEECNNLADQLTAAHAQLEQMRDALEAIAGSPVWSSLTTPGLHRHHTLNIDLARAALAEALCLRG